MTDGRLNCWGKKYSMFSKHQSQSSDVIGPADAAAESNYPQLPPNRVFVQVSCAADHCCALDNEGTYLRTIGKYLRIYRNIYDIIFLTALTE